MSRPDMPLTLNAIGCGRVGQTLLALWHRQGVLVVQDVLTRSPASAQAACEAIGAGRAVTQWQQLRSADLWLVGVPDAQIAGAAQDAADALRHLLPSMVFHCSGAQASRSLQPLQQQGWRTASAHCILSFSSVETAQAQFPGTACALEGDAATCSVLRGAFTAIGARCFDIASDDKLLYHAAAVFATNFLPVLQATAEQLWQHSGVPAEVVESLRGTLLRNAVANITQRGPSGALTGPAARGDREAIARQTQALQAWDPATAAAYASLSALALRLARR